MATYFHCLTKQTVIPSLETELAVLSIYHFCLYNAIAHISIMIITIPAYVNIYSNFLPFMNWNMNIVKRLAIILTLTCNATCLYGLLRFLNGMLNNLSVKFLKELRDSDSISFIF